ncbi:hypothetical protein G6F68_017636 [Rhizopus microsporus]|nr:hypothetical protein G6F68_017636 [Rhizopus microsporus]
MHADPCFGLAHLDRNFRLGHAYRQLAADAVCHFTARQPLVMKVLHHLVEVVEIRILVCWNLFNARLHRAQVSAMSMIDHEVAGDDWMRTQ